MIYKNSYYVIVAKRLKDAGYNDIKEPYYEYLSTEDNDTDVKYKFGDLQYANRYFTNTDNIMKDLENCKSYINRLIYDMNSIITEEEFKQLIV